MDEIGRKKSENIRQSVPFIRQITEDGKPKLEVYRPTTNPIYIWTQVRAMKNFVLIGVNCVYVIGSYC